MELINAIANVLHISENQIKSVDEWAKVYFVRFNVGRPTFVSKRKVEAILPMTWTMECRKYRKAWVAKLNGLDATYVFKRDFLEAFDIKWHRKGPLEMTFKITEPGVYHDSDGDYFVVAYNGDGKLVFVREICRDEAKCLVAKATQSVKEFA